MSVTAAVGEQSVARTAGAILAGGRSSRFGSPKALAKLGDGTILDRVVRAHRAVFDDVVLVGAAPELRQSVEIPTIGDIYRDRGPIGGIHAALRWAADHGKMGICCSPCDAPFVVPELLRVVSSSSAGYDAVVPHDPTGRWEPVFGWFSTRIIARVERSIECDRLALHDLLSQLSGVLPIEITSIGMPLPPEVVFFNVNTREELMRARQLYKDGEG